MPYSFDRFPQLRRTRILVILCLAMAGCGYAEYENRLNETKKYYAYLERIEQTLAPKWVVAGNLMELRVPRQFNLLPAPEPIQLPDGTFEEPKNDPRQPDYLFLPLPGLFGAWQSIFTVSKGNEREDCKGYIYALCNYQQLVGNKASEGTEFVESLKDLLVRTLKIEAKEEPKETYPQGVPISQYQPQFVYDHCIFIGKDIDGLKYNFDLYSRAQGGVVGAILVVLPAEMEQSQKVQERISMMLASFNFTKDPPPVGSTGSPAGTAAGKPNSPSGGSAAGF